MFFSVCKLKDNMNNKYCITIVVLLTLITYMMFCRDIMEEYFTNDTKVGQCMNLYSKTKLKNSGVKLIENPGNRGEDSCPPVLCQFDSVQNKCLPTSQHANNQGIRNYCLKEHYLENISNKQLCEKLGYSWENGKCNASIKRKEDQCPDDLCGWDDEKSTCEPKDHSLYHSSDFDSVSDYCKHLKSLSPTVNPQTCNAAGSSYDYNDLLAKCLNVDVNAENINDKCWGRKNINNCIDDGDEHTNCIWYQNVPSISTPADIKGLRKTELETIEKEVDTLGNELNVYINSVKPYQDKLDKEQAAALIVKMIEQDDKDRYKFETGIKSYEESYQKSF